MSQIGTLIQTLAKGGSVMIPLLGCSVVALAVVIERLGFWWRQGDERAAERALELAARSKLEADTDVWHGIVVDVMDAARLAGVGKLAIAATPRETRP